MTEQEERAARANLLLEHRETEQRYQLRADQIKDCGKSLETLGRRLRENPVTAKLNSAERELLDAAKLEALLADAAELFERHKELSERKNKLGL